jgi:hypothetical protein
VLIGPIGSHTDAQVSAAILYKLLNQGCIVFEYMIVAVAIANPAGHSNHIDIIEKSIFDWIFTEQFEIVVTAQSSHNSVTALNRAFWVTHKKGNS